MKSDIIEYFSESHGLEVSDKAAEIIMYLLKHPLTVTELSEKMNVVAKTVRYWLKWLRNNGIISSIPNLSDMRSSFYVLEQSAMAGFPGGDKK